MTAHAREQGESKRELRAQYKRLRAAQSMDDYLHHSAQIAENVLALKQVQDAKTVYTYVPFKDEVDTRTIARRLLESGKRVLAPGPDHTQPPAQSMHEITGSNDELKLEPVRGLSVEEIDVFLVPGIVFDRRGHRIGFGGGYFDRLLAAARADAFKLGLAFDFQVTDSLPHDDWDIAVDALASEAGVQKIEGKEGGFSNPPLAIG